MKLTRRQFVLNGTALLATLGLGGAMAFAEDDPPTNPPTDPNEGLPILVVIQLSGGNDGLNTIVPYGSGAYYDARPTISIGQSEVLKIDDMLGFHPSMPYFNDMYQNGKLAIVQGVGYPNPNMSHFVSMEIWNTGDPSKFSRTGWLARYLESSLADDPNPIKALQVLNMFNKAFMSDTLNVPVIKTIDSYNMFDPRSPKGDQGRLSKAFLDMYDPERQGTRLKVMCQNGGLAYASVQAIHNLVTGYPGTTEYPGTGIARDLQMVAKMLSGKSGTRVFYLEFGNFDDHVKEKEAHAILLQQLNDAISAFHKDLALLGLQDRVVTMAFSEFGRRIKENGNGGTDHGSAAPVFIFGNKVKGGLYGLMPSLKNMDTHGNLKYELDFRSVYTTIIEGWMKGDAKAVIQGNYENLGLFT